MNDPPWTQTITGRLPSSRPGVQMLRFRQSSDVRSGVPPSACSIIPCACGATGPNPSHSRIPAHGSAGAGGRHRPARRRRGREGHPRERPQAAALDAPHPSAPDLDHSVHPCDLQFGRNRADDTCNLPRSRSRPDPGRARHIGRAHDTHPTPHVHPSGTRPVTRREFPVEGRCSRAPPLSRPPVGHYRAQVVTMTRRQPAADVAPAARPGRRRAAGAAAPWLGGRPACS